MVTCGAMAPEAGAAPAEVRVAAGAWAAVGVAAAGTVVGAVAAALVAATVGAATGAVVGVVVDGAVAVLHAARSGTPPASRRP